MSTPENPIEEIEEEMQNPETKHFDAAEEEFAPDKTDRDFIEEDEEYFDSKGPETKEKSKE